MDILRSDASIRRLPFSASGRRHQSHYQRWQHPVKTARAVLSVMDSVHDLLQLWKHSWEDGDNGMRSLTEEKLSWITCSQRLVPLGAPTQKPPPLPYEPGVTLYGYIPKFVLLTAKSNPLFEY